MLSSDALGNIFQNVLQLTCCISQSHAQCQTKQSKSFHSVLFPQQRQTISSCFTSLCTTDFRCTTNVICSIVCYFIPKTVQFIDHSNSLENCFRNPEIQKSSFIWSDLKVYIKWSKITILIALPITGNC